MARTVQARLLAGAAVSAVALILAVAGPASAGAAARSCANANTLTTSASRQVMRTAVVCLINHQRTSRGLPPLKDSTLLDRSAQDWTNSMAASKDYSHGEDFAARILAAGFRWSAAGENIATDFETPRSVVDGWMGSQGHCANILAPDFSFVGTGVIAKTLSQYGNYFATWTQDFGLPMGAKSPSANAAPAAGCPYTIS